ncbi:hypothetical protein [Gemmatimonas sp. UBA7669]|uniref:hypothetical protein n=1 Tax=Gemmatimonas sp. UBA7669 TaxID=1946568 RepID=UPI0025C0BE93|nr:hypothetical protein [Gemmatimonas sp. UBA7669]
MAHRLSRIRAALGTAATWAMGWAVAGLSIGVLSVLVPTLPLGWFFEVFDAPLPAMAIPGFVGGLCYAAVVRFAGRKRPLREIGFGEVALWGVGGGMLLSAVPALSLLDNGPGGDPDGSWRLPAAIAVLITFSVASAVCSFWLARRAAQRDTQALQNTLRDTLLSDAATPHALPFSHGVANPSFDDNQRTRESSAARGRP